MDTRTKKEIEEYARSFKWTPKDFYWKHALLVRRFALWIQKEVGGDKDVVEIAALLHDTGKAELLAPGHEKISAKLAKEYLERIRFDQEKIEKIVKCISYEDFRFVETRILRSADSMSLIMDKSGGKEWFFLSVLKSDRRTILKELKKSYSEIEFEFAQNLIEKTYKKLLRQYRKT